MVDSYLFFTGDLEFMLSKYNRFVCAHTTRYVVYEFWKCVIENPDKVYDILASPHFKFEEIDFEYLQKKWAHYEDQNIRSALFFLLNKCSSDGSISYGNMENNKLSNVDLAALKTFKKPKNMHLIFDNTEFADSIEKCYGEYTLINVGRYTNNLFEDGKSYGLEETKIDHSEILDIFNTTDKKMIIIYKYDPQVLEKYKDTAKTLTLIDNYGNPTEKGSAAEVLIANF